MLAVVFGLVGATAYGAADFFGGMAARSIGSIRTAWVSSSFGFLGLGIIFALFGGVWSSEALFWGAATGLIGMMVMIFLYASLAIGPMSILSPIGALVSAIVPVAWDVLRGQHLSFISYVGIGVALVAVWFVGFVPDRNAVRPSLRGVLFAILAGAFLGLFLIVIDQAPDESGVLPLLANRVIQVSALTLTVLVVATAHRRRTRRMLVTDTDESADVAAGERGTLNWRRGVAFGASTGTLDAIGNSILLYGLTVGNLSVISVLAAMYPGGTILLAAIVLRERIAKLQYLGLGLALAAAALLALG